MKQTWKLVAKLLLCTVLALSMLYLSVGCGPDTPPIESNPEDTTPQAPTTPPADSNEPEHIPTDFEKYPSNIYAATGHNYVLRAPEGTMEMKTFRCVFSVQEYGEFEYKLFFSNAVDSTQRVTGDIYRNMPTKEYRIASAYIGVVTEETKTNVCPNMKQITFGGSKNKIVDPSERFWSDPVTVNVNEGELLMFEWTVQYEIIPAIQMCNQFYAYSLKYDSQGKIQYMTNAIEVPTPDLIGCDRKVEHRIAFVGDSITQGSGATMDMGWVAQVAKGLGTNVSCWNLGLGYAKADDVKDSPSWSYKASQYDTVVISIGTNDLNTGVYQSPRSQTAQEIYSDIKKMASNFAKEGCRVIIFTTPPYSYHSDAIINQWLQLCKLEEQLASNYNFGFFDLASHMVTEDGRHPAYGQSPTDGHPTSEGCTVAAQAILQSGVLNTPQEDE